MRLLDRDFKYTSSTNTDIVATWRRFGFRPTTERDRHARGREFAAESIPAAVTGMQQSHSAPLGRVSALGKSNLRLATGK